MTKNIQKDSFMGLDMDLAWKFMTLGTVAKAMTEKKRVIRIARKGSFKYLEAVILLWLV